MKSAHDFSHPHWAPSASLKTMQSRAHLMRQIRAYFEMQGVLEVETPMLSAHATVDRHVDSFHADGMWLHTSPEFAMKRLLCAGSGPIWQSCRVFRREEAGRHHNPEFTMLEWYRPGFDHHQLMHDVEALLRSCGTFESAPFERISYREAFLRHIGFDPHQAPIAQMQQCADGLSPPPAAGLGEDRDGWLDYFYGSIVSPALGRDQPCFVYDFPASQAALARVQGNVAERFELVWKGIELANGFHELADADEQQARFKAEQAWRQAQGRAVPPYDQHLIAALRYGLPDCAGVALGIDRLLMLLLSLPDMAMTLAFPLPRA